MTEVKISDHPELENILKASKQTFQELLDKATPLAEQLENFTKQIEEEINQSRERAEKYLEDKGLTPGPLKDCHITLDDDYNTLSILTKEEHIREKIKKVGGMVGEAIQKAFDESRTKKEEK